MPTAKEENTASGKPIAKARPRQKPKVTLTSISIPVREREWIDIKTQRSHDQKCYEVSKAITRLLRHDQTVPRGIDGAIHCNDIIGECRMQKFDASQWLLEDWISTLATGGERRRYFTIARYQTHPINSCTFKQFKDIQEKVRLILHCKTVYLFRKDLRSPPRREREWIEFFNKKWINSRRNKPQKRKTSGLLHYSESDVKMVWVKLHATWRNQGSPHTRILWNDFKRQYVGAIWSLPKRDFCNFTKRGHMQSFSTTHYLQLALRKRYVWKLRVSSTRRYAWLRGYHE